MLTIINVEVQVNPERGFRERLVFLNSRTFSSQMRKGNKYWMLNRTITIVVADFILIDENKDCFNQFRWYNSKNDTLLTSIQEIDVLELPKLPIEDDGSNLWKWLMFLKSGREDEMEDLAKDSIAMKEVMVSLRKMSADETERRYAEQREKDEWDRIAQIEYGRMEGETRAKQEVAKNMKSLDISVEIISQVTGLSLGEIADI